MNLLKEIEAANKKAKRENPAYKAASWAERFGVDITDM